MTSDDFKLQHTVTEYGKSESMGLAYPITGKSCSKSSFANVSSFLSWPSLPSHSAPHLNIKASTTCTVETPEDRFEPQIAAMLAAMLAALLALLGMLSYWMKMMKENDETTRRRDPKECTSMHFIAPHGHYIAFTCIYIVHKRNSSRPTQQNICQQMNWMLKQT